MPKITSCLFDDKSISINVALDLKNRSSTKLNFTCIGCGEVLIAHKASSYGEAHFEHYSKNESCSMMNNEIAESIVDWKSTVEANAYNDSIGALVESTLSASAIVDKVSTWAIIGTATFVGFFITNIEKIRETVYSDEDIKYLLVCLALSMLFAILQKYMAIASATSLKVADEMKNRMKPVLDNYYRQEEEIEITSEHNNLDIYANLNFDEILNSYIELYPKWVQFLFKSRYKRILEDRVYSYKILLSRFIYQSASTFLQYILIIVFIILAGAFL